MNDVQVARGLGWFSLGLGLYEVLAPRHLAETLGMADKSGTIRFYGVREIGAGLGILTQPGNALAPWLWGRTSGDALDIGTLVAGLAQDNPKKANAVTALAMVLGVTALDIWCARSLSQRGS